MGTWSLCVGPWARRGRDGREVPSGLGILPGTLGGGHVPGQGVDSTGPEAPDSEVGTQPLQSVFLSVGWVLVSKPQTPVLSLLLETSGEPEEGSLQKTENLYPNPG